MKTHAIKRPLLTAIVMMLTFSSTLASVNIINTCDNNLPINAGYIDIDNIKFKLNKEVTKTPLKISDINPKSVKVEWLGQKTQASQTNFHLDGTTVATGHRRMQEVTITISNCMYYTPDNQTIYSATLDMPTIY